MKHYYTERIVWFWSIVYKILHHINIVSIKDFRGLKIMNTSI